MSKFLNEDGVSILWEETKKLVEKVHSTGKSKTQGLYKLSVDTTGHVNNATEVTKNDITALGIAATTDLVKNTSNSDGYVLKSNGAANKVWGTDSSGTPKWRSIEELTGHKLEIVDELPSEIDENTIYFVKEG